MKKNTKKYLQENPEIFAMLDKQVRDYYAQTEEPVTEQSDESAE